MPPPIPTIPAQVGELILGRIYGTALSADDEAMLRECHFAGVVLFADNLGTPEEARALTARIAAICGRPGQPAIIALDQEGGRVQRLGPPATSFPSAMAVGATGSAEHAERWGIATAREIRSLGFSMNFAPVLDVNNNPANPVIGTRSYGERPDEVARLALAAAKGLQSGGVAVTAKHFPGHGDTGTDSHYDLPTIAGDRARLDAIELPPFRAAIAAGFPAIMTSHIVFPALDPDGLPCTLSPRLLGGLLRDELGFEGVIVSDAMNMRAIADRWGIPEGCVRFIEAGGDLVEPIGEDRAAHAALVAAVESGRISAARLAEARARVATLREQLAAQTAADPAWLGAAEHRAWAAAIARDAVTLLRDDAGTLPLRRDARVAVLELAHVRTMLDDPEGATRGPFALALADSFPDLSDVTLDGGEPRADEIADARAAVAEADAVIVGTRATNRFPAQAAFVRDLLGWGKPTVAVALADPYDSLAYPAAPTALATYGADPAILAALAAVLTGDEPARGRLPVTVGEQRP